MLVATGTTTVLPQGTVQAMAAAFAALPAVSFVWSLKQVLDACMHLNCSYVLHVLIATVHALLQQI